MPVVADTLRRHTVGLWSHRVRQLVLTSGDTLRDVVLPFVCTRLALLAVGEISLRLIPGDWRGSAPAVPPPGLHGLIALWCRWDCGWYVQTAQAGYMLAPLADGSNQANWAFWPLFPLLIRGVTFLTANYVVSAVLIANVLGLIGIWVVYRLAIFELDLESARRCVLYLLLFPTSLFL